MLFHHNKIGTLQLFYFLSVIIICLCTGSNFGQEIQKSFGNLTVIITGFSNEEGNCRFALDNSKSVYEREDSVWIGKVLPIINKKVVVEIDSLAFGEYAVRVFHDENKNEEIDTNILGIPTEEYGYSNDASDWFGPPSWEKAKFRFNKTEMKIEIEVDSFL